MMALYNIPFPRSIGLFSHQVILGMQHYPTTVSYWLEKSDGRKVLLRRVRKPLIEKSGLTGYSCLNIPTPCNATELKCYVCYSRSGKLYYSIAPSLVVAMQVRKFWTTKGRVYPKCQAKKNDLDLPLVPQWTLPFL